jgi:hypothetical protein
MGGTVTARAERDEFSSESSPAWLRTVEGELSNSTYRGSALTLLRKSATPNSFAFKK